MIRFAHLGNSQKREDSPRRRSDADLMGGNSLRYSRTIPLTLFSWASSSSSPSSSSSSPSCSTIAPNVKTSCRQRLRRADKRAAFYQEYTCRHTRASFFARPQCDAKRPSPPMALRQHASIPLPPSPPRCRSSRRPSRRRRRHRRHRTVPAPSTPTTSSSRIHTFYRDRNSIAGTPTYGTSWARRRSTTTPDDGLPPRTSSDTVISTSTA